MYLRALEIKNYRSLRHVKMEGLERFNTLIGRNNAGKSSIFGALSMLNRYLHSELSASVQALPIRDSGAELGIMVLFHTRQQSRERFLDLISREARQIVEARGQTTLTAERRVALIRSPLLRQIAYMFRAPAGTPHLLHLRETRTLLEDGEWGVIQQLDGDENTSNPNSIVVSFSTQLQGDPTKLIDKDTLGTFGRAGLTLTPPHILNSPNPEPAQRGDPILMWPFWQLGRYFDKAFFFEPHRRSLATAKAEEAAQLAQDGANLAQRLHTISSNDRARFHAVEEFVQAALPHIGMLHAPIRSGETEVSFLPPGGGPLVPLHNMGSGIEQLLMVATVLLTTDDESTIFLEEPESHLHAGAQRVLINRLREDERQVFITTHSPIFVNLSRPGGLYQVTLSGGQTSTARISDTDSEALSGVMEDIGARNSDVLLSNAVLFTEGPSDKATLGCWSETLRKAFTEHNVTLLPMGGGEYAERGAPVRSDLLSGISQQAPVPHLFVIDGDERSQQELDRLQSGLGDRLHILTRRELENYLLIPRALLEAIGAKHKDNSVIGDKLNQATLEEVEKLIAATADGLYSLVLLKRIRAEIEGFKGGLFAREMLGELVADARNPELPTILHGRLERRVGDHLASIDLAAIVAAQRAALDSQWANPQQRLTLAPGTEILEAVFRHFGAEYSKRKDAALIARAMREDEIDAEIREVIEKAIALTSRST